MSNQPKEQSKPLSRKDFFKYSGAFASAIALSFYGCEDDMTSPTSVNNEELNALTAAKGKDGDPVNLGSGDVGILNYAYALEQLEAAFYTKVLETPPPDLSSEEMRVLEDLRKHEVAHRDFYQAALGDNAIPALEVDFSSINFENTESVLVTSRTFEDLGVSAYNGAGHLLEDPELLLVAGKIVSVEGRHAAAIRDLLKPRTAHFAGDDIIDENGLDVVRTPSEVLDAASAFIVTEIDASNLPQSNITFN